jgi:hypothetical protein
MHPFGSSKAAAAALAGPSPAGLSSSALLLEVLLAAAIFKRLARAVLQELPAALKSKQGERFESGCICRCGSRKFKAVWLPISRWGRVAGQWV